VTQEPYNPPPLPQDGGLPQPPQPTYLAPGATPAPGTSAMPGVPLPSETVSTRKAMKKGPLIAGGVALLAVLGGGAWAVNHFVVDKVNGAQSPEAAVTKLFDALENQESLGVYGAIDPMDVRMINDPSDRFFERYPDMDRTQIKDTLIDALHAFKLSSSDLALSSEDLGDGYARVFIDEGNFSLDADVDKVADLAVSTVNTFRGMGLIKLIEEEAGPLPADDETRTTVKEGLDGQFPVTFTADDLRAPALDNSAFTDGLGQLEEEFGSSDLDSLLGDSSGFGAEPDLWPPMEPELTYQDSLTDSTDADSNNTDLNNTDTSDETVQFALIATKDDSGWYVSPSLTYLDFALRTSGITPDYSLIPAGTPAKSPEQAASNLVNGFIAGLKEGKTTGGLGALVEYERRFSVIPVDQATSEQIADGLAEVLKQINISDAEFELDHQEGNLAYLKLKSWKIEGTIEQQDLAVELSSDCASVNASGLNLSVCLRDIPAAQELGIDQLRVIARKVDGGWYISGLESSADGSGTLLANVDRLAREGKLTDSQWWSDNSGVLGQLAESFM